MEFDGKVVLVTGGANGIGLEFTKQFLKNNVKAVAILDLNEEDGKNAAKELGPKVLFIKTDVTNKLQFEDAFKKILDTFGHLDIVVNNAGLVGGDNYELEIAVNSTAVTTGTILGMKYMGKHNGANGGTILNTASIAGIMLLPLTAIYTSTKHFVVALGKCFGTDFYYNLTGVKVLTYCPTFTATKLIANKPKTLSGFGDLKEICDNMIKQIPLQSPVRCAEEMIIAMRNGKSGSVWVNHADKPVYEQKNTEMMIPNNDA